MTAPAWVQEHLRPGERARWWGRPARAAVLAVVLSGALAVAVTLVSFALGYQRAGILLSGAPALAVAVGGIAVEAGRRIVRLLRTSYVVTDERLVVLTARFATDLQSVPLARVARVELRQSLAGRIFGYWGVGVGTTGEQERGRVHVRAVEDGAGLLQELSRGAAENARADWLSS